jgi:sugar lactone lactonase YvrE
MTNYEAMLFWTAFLAEDGTGYDAFQPKGAGRDGVSGGPQRGLVCADGEGLGRLQEAGMSEVRCIAETKNLVGEGPLWDAAGQRLYWTDINGMRVYRLDLRSGRIEHWQFAVTVSALGLTTRTGWLLVAAGLQLLLWNVESDERVVFAQVEDAETGNRLNDGAVGPDGNFWVGTMRNNVGPDGAHIEVDWERTENRCGSLYRVSPEGTVERYATGLAIPNTMVWSPDGSKMYTGDSMDNAVYAYDYGAGSVSRRRVFTQGFGRGVPDGSAMDEEGFIWNCRYFGSCAVRFAPSGEVDRVVEMPVKNITNCAFGGADLRTLFVTTAGVGDGEADTRAGGLFAVEVGVVGLAENLFRAG